MVINLDNSALNNPFQIAKVHYHAIFGALTILVGRAFDGNEQLVRMTVNIATKTVVVVQGV